ncbi:MAG: SRPBCC family protein [Symploca sp. SIO2D2]|nr:SRPBCC family protein [Symploca sp. SIO2D2]
MTRVFKSAVINAPIAPVWMKIRDFNAMPDWHPIIADSYIEKDEPSDKVGCIRNFNLKEGGNIRERLLTLSDSDYLFSYSILEAPMPVKNYVATLLLQPITDGDLTYIQWKATFDCDPQEENGLIELIGNGVFQTGFNGLNQIFSK